MTTSALRPGSTLQSHSRADARRERGSGTLLLAAAAVGFIAAVWLSVVVAGWWSAGHRAEDVADMAALAAGRAEATGEAACLVAEQTARANGTQLISCQVHTAPTGFTVTVEIGMHVHRGWELPGMPRMVVKMATAGPME
ncbi:Rv3654c family TadE-like protein [Cutibacterium sp. V947]|uniref:Rv3654c family TadE-like protein n=1 Tax=unclassified Cutibacterium TaxID=2649671 RepID=UPI003EDF3ABA